jgi:hypothetical protein
LKLSKSVHLPVRIFLEDIWYLYDAERPSDIEVGFDIADGSSGARESLLRKAFEAEAREYQERMFEATKRLKQLAEQHQVDVSEWERTVAWLWVDDRGG